MEQLALIVPGMWADHHVIAVRGLFREVEGVEVSGASAMDATLRLEYDPAKTDPQRIAARLEAGRLRHRRGIPMPTLRRRTSRRG